MTQDEQRKRHLALKQYDVLQNGPEEEFEQIIDLTCRLFSTPIAAITLLDGTQHVIKGQRGPTDRPLSDTVFLDHTLAAPGALIVEDAHHDARFSDHTSVASPSGHRAFLGAALCTPDGTRIGTICAIDTVARGFSDIDGDIMEQLAAITVANLELRLIASKDATSGADSRRAFMDVLGRELERHRRTGTKSTLLLCRIEPPDIADGPARRDPLDAAVREVAGHIRSFMRKTDALGRVGPHCLAVLLVDVGPEETDAAVDRFRQALKGSRIETDIAGFGHASASPDYASGADWLAAADAAAGGDLPPRSRTDPLPATHLGIGTRWMN
jgi:GGDEF domain-containing protein